MPLDDNTKFTYHDGEKIEDAQLYRSIIGSLIYATITRLDIVHIVGVLSQFIQEPMVNHLKVLLETFSDTLKEQSIMV